jgi:peroxiredoxin
MKSLVLFTFLLASIQFSNAQEQKLGFPERIPEFSIYAEDGAAFTNKDLVKNKNIIFIYFNPTCGHCKNGFKTLNINFQNLKLDNLHVYPVSSGTVKETQMFFKNLAPNLANLKNIEVIYDEDYRFADAFFVSVFPHSFLYGKDHNFIGSYEGQSKILDPLKELQKK